MNALQNAASTEPPRSHQKQRATLMPAVAVKRSIPAAALNQFVAGASAALKIIFSVLLIVTVPYIAVFAVPAMFPRRRERTAEERLAANDAYRKASRWRDCDIS